MTDLLGYIAHARAQMLMRGFEPLRIEIGSATLQQLRREARPYAPFDDDGAEPPSILGLAFVERTDIEGFVVVPLDARLTTV